MATANIKQEIHRHEVLLAALDFIEDRGKSKHNITDYNMGVVLDGMRDELEWSLHNLKLWSDNDTLSAITDELRDY